jgi:hypothetical protein
MDVLAAQVRRTFNSARLSIETLKDRRVMSACVGDRYSKFRVKNVQSGRSDKFRRRGKCRSNQRRRECFNSTKSLFAVRLWNCSKHTSGHGGAEPNVNSDLEVSALVRCPGRRQLNFDLNHLLITVLSGVFWIQCVLLTLRDLLIRRGLQVYSSQVHKLHPTRSLIRVI